MWVSYLAFLFFAEIYTCESTRVPFPSSTLLISGGTLYRGIYRRSNITEVCSSGDELSWLSPKWKNYISCLCDSIVKKRERSLLENKQKVGVVVVGGGPVGLMSGIIAFIGGADVVVIDKRTEYNRDVWFDISAKPWGAGLELLKSWGFLDMIDELESPGMDESDILQVRCQMLERFLAQTAMLVGVDIRHGLEFKGFDKDNTKVITTIGDEFPFDLVVAADGINSRVRESLGVAFVGHHISQYSMVLDFVKCPTKKDDVAPWDIAKFVEGVPFIFRRFFMGECHMQILFTDAKKKTLPANETPWRLIQDVLKHSIEEDFSNLDELKNEITQIDIVDVKMNRAEKGTIWLPNNKVAVLLGDSVMSAHYRLGIGINNALNTMSNFGTFVRRLSIKPKMIWRRLTLEKAEIDEKRLARMWGHQVKTMWLEAYCGYHLFFSHARSEDEDEDDFQEDHFYTLSYTPPVDPTPSFSIRKLTNGQFYPTSFEYATEECEHRLQTTAPWKVQPTTRDETLDTHHKWDSSKRDEL